MNKKILPIIVLLSLLINFSAFSYSGETNTGTTIIPIEDSFSGSIIEPEAEESIPDFDIEFQNPSYIVGRDLVQDEYICDESKDECKINFKLSYLDKDISSKMLCVIDFGFAETGEEDKCNPNTIIFPQGNNEVVFKVYDKNNSNNYKEKKITISNIISIEVEITGTGEVDTGGLEEISGTGTVIESGTGTVEESGTGATSSGVLVEVPDFDIAFQNPSYILGKDLIQDEYICDESKDECKINFKLSYLDKDISSKFFCTIDFGFGETGEEDKCNPATVVFPQGETLISFIIYDKKNIVNYKEKKLSIINTSLIPEEDIEPEATNTGTIVETRSGVINTGSLLVIPDFSYEFQNPSYLLEKNLIKNSYNCDESKDECKINLKYFSLSKDISSKFICKTTFSFGITGEEDKCNPLAVTLPDGETEVSLKVLEKTNEDNFIEKVIKINNLAKVHKSSSGKTKRSLNLDPSIIPKAKITLQGVVGKGKILSGNKLTCSGVDRCSVNLTGADSIGKKLIHTWVFGNGDLFIGENPKSIWFNTGEYKITHVIKDLLGRESEDVFYVHVVSSENEEEENMEPEILLEESEIKGIIISKFLVNPDGSDEGEWIELKNIGEKEVNLRGFEIDDIIVKGSKKYRIDNDLILKPNKSEKFYRNDTKIILNNSGDEINLFYNSILVHSVSRDYSVASGEVISTDKKAQYEQSIDTKYILGLIKSGVNFYFSDIDLSPIYEKTMLANWEFLKQEKVLVKKETENKIKKPRFSQSIAKQKKALKIYGYTEESTLILLNIGDSEYYLNSDSKGNYSLKLTTLEPGDYLVKSRVIDIHGNEFIIPRTKEFSLEKEYLLTMQTYNDKNLLVANSTKSKKKKNIKSKTDKNKKSYSIISAASAKDDLKGERKTNDLIIIKILLGVISVLFLFLIVKKRKLI